MSDHEFDNYLSLLSGLLRLDPQQRGKIAEELRSHLEDRLDELLAAGVSRDEAVRQALAEFGDAAGLAAGFASISWNRRRRWIMRATTFSVAATLLLAAGIVTFWPGRNAGPGLAQSVAQDKAEGKDKADKAEAKKEKGEKPADGKPAQSEQQLLEEQLNRRFDLQVIETPLKDVVLHLQEKTGIPFLLDAKHLEEAGVSIDTPITKSLPLRLRTTLDLMLSELDLTYVLHDEYVLITTPEFAETKLLIRVYDCRDLLSMEGAQGMAGMGGYGMPGGYGGMGGGFGGQGGMGGGGGFFAVQDEENPNAEEKKDVEPAAGSDPNVAAASEGGAETMMGGAGGMSGMSASGAVNYSAATRLMKLIQTNVAPDSWAEQGGPGSISEYGGLIVITQTAHTHNEVERVLDMMRKAAGIEIKPGGSVVR